MGTVHIQKNESEFWPRGERSVEAEVKLSSSLPLPDKLSAAARARDALACAVVLVYVLCARIAAAQQYISLSHLGIAHLQSSVRSLSTRAFLRMFPPSLDRLNFKQ